MTTLPLCGSEGVLFRESDLQQWALLDCWHVSNWKSLNKSQRGGQLRILMTHPHGLSLTHPTLPTPTLFSPFPSVGTLFFLLLFHSVLQDELISNHHCTNKTSFHENVLFTSHPPTRLMWKKCICFKVWPSLSVTTDGQWIVSGSACSGRCSCENLSNVETERMKMTDWHFLFYSVWNIFIGSEVKHKH